MYPDLYALSINQINFLYSLHTTIVSSDLLAFSSEEVRLKCNEDLAWIVKSIHEI